MYRWTADGGAAQRLHLKSLCCKGSSLSPDARSPATPGFFVSRGEHHNKASYGVVSASAWKGCEDQRKNDAADEAPLLQCEARLERDAHRPIEIFDRDSNDPLALGIFVVPYESHDLLGQI